MHPGALGAVVSSATLGDLTTCSTSRMYFTLKAMSSPTPSMVAATTVSFEPVSSDWAEISTEPGSRSPADLISRRATLEPSRAKISACLQALSSAGVERMVRDLYERGLSC